VPLLPFGRPCPLLSDLVGCDSPLQIVMAVWRTIIFSRGLSHPTQKVQIQTKRAPNFHYFLQRAVIPTGRAASPSDNISGRFFKDGEPFDDINSRSFLTIKKGLVTLIVTTKSRNLWRMFLMPTVQSLLASNLRSSIWMVWICQTIRTCKRRSVIVSL
jgi:hypothetical protein